MSDTTVTEVATQPAPSEQTAVEQKSTGQMGVSELARTLMGNKTPYQPFQPKIETPAPAKEAKAPEVPVTEEAPAPSAEVKAEETKTEAQAEPAEETEAETEEVPSNETQALDPKLQEKINRRIGKEVGKTKKAIERAAAAEARATELETRLANQEPIEKEVQVPIPANVPLADITTLDALQTYKENLASDIVEAEMLLYTDFPQEGKDTKWGKVTKEALIAALTQAKKDERVAIPAREKFLNTRTQSMQTAQQKFTFLKDPLHPGYQMAKPALRDNPVLRGYPNSDYLVGMLVKGQLAMQAEEAAAKVEGGKSPPKPKPKPTNGQSEIASDASPTRAPTGMMAANALSVERAKIVGGKNTIGQKGLAALLLANQRNRNSQ
jgi:hypothetical protein